MWMDSYAEVKKDGKWELVEFSDTDHTLTWPHDILWDIASGDRIKGVDRGESAYPAGEGEGTLGYANLKDLLDFDWDSEVDLAMCLFSEEQYKAYKQAEDPVKVYAENKYYINPRIPTCSKNLVILSEQQYLGLKKKNPKKVYIILVHIQSTYRELADPKWWKMVEELKLVGKPEDIKISFCRE